MAQCLCAWKRIISHFSSHHSSHLQNITNYIICRENQLVEPTPLMRCIHLWDEVFLFVLLVKMKNGFVSKAICSQIKWPSTFEQNTFFRLSEIGVENGVLWAKKKRDDAFKFILPKQSIAKRHFLLIAKIMRWMKVESNFNLISSNSSKSKLMDTNRSIGQLILRLMANVHTKKTTHWSPCNQYLLAIRINLI